MLPPRFRTRLNKLVVFPIASFGIGSILIVVRKTKRMPRECRARRADGTAGAWYTRSPLVVMGQTNQSVEVFLRSGRRLDTSSTIPCTNHIRTRQEMESTSAKLFCTRCVTFAQRGGQLAVMDASVPVRFARHRNIRQRMTYVHSTDRALQAAIDPEAKDSVTSSGKIRDDAEIPISETKLNCVIASTSQES
jgi:hypothetical protein